MVLVLEVTDMEKSGAIMNDSNVQEAKERHTIVDPILLSMPVAVLKFILYSKNRSVTHVVGDTNPSTNMAICKTTASEHGMNYISS